MSRSGNGNGSNGERIRFLGLRARNIKCLREVEITDTGDFLEIRGDSGQGKTALLDAIRAALMGLDPKMIRNGEDSAEVELTLSEALVNRITQRSGEETLLVKDEKGSPMKAKVAKDFLAALCDGSAFDPIAWVLLGGGAAKGQTERRRLQRLQLLEALPLTLTEKDVARAVRDLGGQCAAGLKEVNLDEVSFSQHALSVCAELGKACFEFRTLQNSKAEEAEETLRRTPAPEKAAPDADVKVCEKHEREARRELARGETLVETREAEVLQLEKARSEVKRLEALKLRDVKAIADMITVHEGQIAEAETQIEELEKRARELRKAVRSTRETMKPLEVEKLSAESLAAKRAFVENAAGAMGAADVDVAALEEAVANTVEGLRRRRDQDAHDEAAATATRARDWAETFTELVKLFRDDLPKELVAGADLPVEGLSVDEDEIFVNGVPLHQLGTSQQIGVGVDIAARLNTHAGFVLIDRAESLGRDDRRALMEEAKAKGLQPIMTFVDPDAKPGGEGVVVMKDGEAIKA